MPPRCLLCASSDRAAIEKALVQGVTLRNIVTQFGPAPGLSLSTLHRHKVHMARALAKAEARREVRLGDSLLSDLERIRAKLWLLYEGAALARDGAAQVVVLRELRATVDALDQKLERVAKAAPAKEITIHVTYENEELAREKARLLEGGVARERVAQLLIAKVAAEYLRKNPDLAPSAPGEDAEAVRRKLLAKFVGEDAAAAACVKPSRGGCA